MKKQTEDLYHHILEVVDPSLVFHEYIHEANWNSGSNSNVWCPFHNPKGKLAAQSPSLSVNIDTGQFFCHSCQAKGSNVVQFYQQLTKLDFKQTLLSMFSKYIHPIVSDRFIHHWHDNLMNTPEILSWLKEKRGIPASTIAHNEILIGFDGDRITIPVKNEFGLYVNVRRYDFRGIHERKMLNYKEKYGIIELLLLFNTAHDTVFLTEGEWDALLLMALGFAAVTPTGGVGSWSKPPEKFNKFLRGKNVVIVFDMNDPQDVGQKCAEKRANLLTDIAKSVKVLKLPVTKRGGDITDYFMEDGHTVEEFQQLVDETPFWSYKEEIGGNEPNTVYEADLGDASESKFTNKKVRSRILVAGKEASPQSTPSEVEFTCPAEPSKRCMNCPHGESASNKDKFELHPDPSRILDFSTLTAKGLEKYIKDVCGYPTDCKSASVDYLKYVNIERAMIVPDALHTDREKFANYVQRDGYYIGHGLQSNSTYEITSTPVPHPLNQKIVHVITEAKSIQTSYENFRMTPDIHEQLKVFQTDDLESMLTELYADYAYHLTGIVGRPWLHMAMDLVFFSPLDFYFGKEHIHKGWLDVFIGGDSKTGKGKIVEALIKFYQAGEIIDAGNCTKAGLIGGVNQQDGRNFITWGRYVLNDGKLLVIDELSSLDPMIIKDLSRPRSEGIADIIKINTDRARCRTRLIMISNPRDARQVSRFNYGVEVVKNVLEQHEDITRCDYAYITAEHDVRSEDINRDQTIRPASKYISPAAQYLVQFVWSRNTRQVMFRQEARDLVLREAIRLGEKYSPEIPLVQASNVRLKIAKVAAALAGRSYSVNPRADKLIVTEACVVSAVKFLEKKCYDTPTMAYDQFSAGMRREHEVTDPNQVKKLINNYLSKAPQLVGQLMNRKVFSVHDIKDYCGMDMNGADTFKSQLIQAGCLFKVSGDRLVKTSGFQDILKQLKAQYEKKGPPKFKESV